jgi:hypothetical protein
MSTQVPPSRLDSTKDFSSLVPSAFARANAAFAQANNSTDTWVRGQANNAYDTANAAFLQANNSTDSWVRTQANNSFNKANSAADFANASFLVANSAAAWGNHATVGYATTIYVSNAIANLVNSAPVTLDTLNELAAALGDDANFSTTIATSIGVTNSFANGSFVRANSSYVAQNTTASFANGAFDRANSAASFANGAFVTANASYSSQNTTASFANGAFTTANSGATFANAAFVTANSGANFANGAFVTANALSSIASGAFDRANAAYAQANTGGGADAFARTQANSSFNTANAAFATANAAFAAANTGGGGGTTAAYVKTYYWKGALTENVGTLRHYIPLVTANVTSITSYLASPGLTQSTAVVKKNGTVINTIRFAGAGTSNTQTGLTIPVTSSDYLTVDITQSSSGSDLYINFIYQG